AVLAYRVLNAVGGGFGSSTGLKPGTDDYFAWMYLAARSCVGFDTASAQDDMQEDEWNSWVDKLNALDQNAQLGVLPCPNATRLEAAKQIVNAYIKDAGGSAYILSDVPNSNP